MWSCRPKIGQKSRSFWGGAQGRVRDRYTDTLIASLQSNHRNNVYCKIFGMLSSPSRFLTPLILHFRWFAEVSRINYLAHSKPDRAAFSSKYPNIYNRRVMCGATKVLCYTGQVHPIPGSASCHESWRLRKFLDNYHPFLLADPRGDDPT